MRVNYPNDRYMAYIRERGDAEDCVRAKEAAAHGQTDHHA